MIGEDLGTVEPWLREALAARGALGTQMLWFERGWSNEPLAPQWWRRNSPGDGLHARPAAGRRVPVRITGDRPARARPAHPLRGRGAGGGRRRSSTTGSGAWSSRACCRRATGPTADEFTAALYGYLAQTPALLIGVNLAEAAGEIRSQNMPGTSTEYPNWMLPLCGPDGEPVLLEDLATSARVRAVAGAVPAPSDQRPGIGRLLTALGDSCCYLGDSSIGCR